MPRPHPRSFAASFTILYPDVDSCVNPDATNTVEVKVRDSGMGNTGYEAAITDVGTAPLAFTPLVMSGGQIFTGRLDLGIIPASTAVNNKTVTVLGFRGSHVDSDAKDFRAQRDPCSGSGSSGSDGIRMGAQRCQFCHAHQPVPVALTLRLDTPVSPGSSADCGRLNQPTILRHAGHPGAECSWFSHPIDFCSDSANPALWMLHKSDAKTWMLFLRRGKTDIVVYRHSTRAAKDCSFPIQLQIAGAGGGECKDWPRTVTISPTP